MYVCHQPLGLLYVGLVGSVVGIVFLSNVVSVSERVAGFFGSHGLTGRGANKPAAWRLFGVVTVGWAIPVSIWAFVQC